MKASDLRVVLFRARGYGAESADFMLSLEEPDSIRLVLIRHEQCERIWPKYTVGSGRIRRLLPCFIFWLEQISRDAKCRFARCIDDCAK